MQRQAVVLFLSLALPAVACLRAEAQEPETSVPVEDDQYGRTVEHAIEACKPDGQRAYLARLVCADSSHPSFSRLGSVGMRHDFPEGMSEEDQLKVILAAMERRPLEPGETDHHMVDGYAVECDGEKITLYLDMYHCDVPPPTRPAAGFTIF